MNSNAAATAASAGAPAQDPQAAGVPAPREAPPPTTGNIDPTTLPFFGEDFVYLDTESTGLDPEVDRICEIALVRYRAGQREVFHTLVDPEMHIPATASAVHGITDEMICEARAPKFAEIAAKVREMLGGAHVWCHNREHDAPFVDRALGVESDTQNWLCTYRLSRHVFPEAPAHGNMVLRYWLRTNPESAGLGPHRAVDDVFTSLESMFHIWKRAEARGVTTTYGLLELCNSTIWMQMIPFGEHAGKGLDEIPSQYLEWALGKVPGKKGMNNLDDDARASLERELARPGRDDALQAKVTPADVMHFGKQHNGKPMTAVPLEYLEWIERDNPRCSAEVRAGVKLELSRRRADTPALEGASADLAAATFARLRSLVNKGSEEESRLLGTQDAANPEAAFLDYLRAFAADRSLDYLRVADLTGAQTGAWMRELAGLPAERHAKAPVPLQLDLDAGAQPQPQPLPQTPLGAPVKGRIRLLTGVRSEDPSEDESMGANEPPEESAVPFESQPASRRLRMR